MAGSTTRKKKGRQPAKPGCRQPLVPYDRVKVSIGILIVFGFFVAADISKNPLISAYDAADNVYVSQVWIPILLIIELFRQAHNFIAENSKQYWALWTTGSQLARLPFSGLSAFTRYRLARNGQILFWLFLWGSILSKLLGGSGPIDGYIRALGTLFSNMPILFQILLPIMAIILQFAALFWFMSKGGVEVVMPEDVKTNFDMVWGQDQVIAKVRETIQLLDDPDMIEAKGGYVPGGILLWGPPGTGKTLIAEAMAGETGKPFVLVEPGAFQAMFIGVNIIKVKGLYRKLRKLSLRYGGVVVFFDEADVLGKRAMSGGKPRGFRSQSANLSLDNCGGASLLTPAGQHVAGGALGNMGPVTNGVVVPMNGGGGADLGTLNAILASMQGLKKPRGVLNKLRGVLGLRRSSPPKYRILHVMATNMPDSLDDALLRPGRIDRIFRVGYPSKEGRIRTFNGYFDKVRHELTADDIERLATSSPYSSGAVIKDIVNESLMGAIRDGREVIKWADVVAAKSLKEHGTVDGFEYIDRERHAVAIHEACHAVAAYRLKADFAIDVATIERRGDIGGFVNRVPLVERMFQWKSEAEHDIQIAIASLVGERMFFDGDNTNGVSGDMEAATRLALVMESRWGMGSTLASHHVLMDGAAGGAGDGERPGGEPGDGTEGKVSSVMGVRIERRLAELFDRTVDLLEENRYQVLSLAHALEVHRTLNGADVEAIIEGVQGPLIDGGLYAKPETRVALEGYHDAALGVHRTAQGAAELPMFDASHALTRSAGSHPTETFQ